MFNKANINSGTGEQAACEHRHKLSYRLKHCHDLPLERPTTKLTGAPLYGAPVWSA